LFTFSSPISRRFITWRLDWLRGECRSVQLSTTLNVIAIINCFLPSTSIWGRCKRLYGPTGVSHHSSVQTVKCTTYVLRRSGDYVEAPAWDDEQVQYITRNEDHIQCAVWGRREQTSISWRSSRRPHQTQISFGRHAWGGYFEYGTQSSLHGASPSLIDCVRIVMGRSSCYYVYTYIFIYIYIYIYIKTRSVERISTNVWMTAWTGGEGRRREEAEVLKSFAERRRYSNWMRV